jgi:hypothetical protein
MAENSLLALPPLCIESNASNAGMHKFPLSSSKFLSVPPARIRTKSTYNCSDENYDNLFVADSDSIVSASVFLSLFRLVCSHFHQRRILSALGISLPSALLQPSHAQFCRSPSTDCKYYLGWQRREPEAAERSQKERIKFLVSA